jgi:hypothetical protein
MKKIKKAKKVYEWKEQKIHKISFGMFNLNAIMVVTMPILFVTKKLGLELFATVQTIAICGAIGFALLTIFTSTQKKYTTKFLEENREKLNQTKSIEELYQLRKCVYYQSVEDGAIRLSYPLEVKSLLNDIGEKINNYELLISFCKCYKGELQCARLEDAEVKIERFFKYLDEQNEKN